jgi:hypothetical protein
LGFGILNRYPELLERRCGRAYGAADVGIFEKGTVERRTIERNALTATAALVRGSSMAVALMRCGNGAQP